MKLVHLLIHFSATSDGRFELDPENFINSHNLILYLVKRIVGEVHAHIESFVTVNLSSYQKMSRQYKGPILDSSLTHCTKIMT